MGVAALNGLQLVDRLSLFFMPKKYQPDLPYLRRVPILKVHLFTLIQVGCLASLWIIKDISVSSVQISSYTYCFFSKNILLA